MRKCPNTDLPAVYVDADAYDYSDPARIDRRAVPLEIYEVDYLHYHSTMEIGLCDSGEGFCYVEDNIYPFRAGDVQIVFPFQRHLSRSTTSAPSNWYWLNLDCNAILERGGFTDFARIEGWISTQMALCGIFSKQEHPEINRLVKALILSIWDDSRETPYYGELVCSYLYTLIFELLRASYALPKLSLPLNKKLFAVSPALMRIRQAVTRGEPVHTAELAAACSMSDTNFRRVFCEAVGMPPKKYIMKCRIKKAEHLLLATDETILAISEQVGFADVSGFNRQFMQKNGMSPSQFQKKYKTQRDNAARK